MKIGIMTLWWSDDNYGQLLQCYALQKYLRDAGHNAYLIRYKPKNDYIETPLWKKLLKACNPIKLYHFIGCKINKLAVYKKVMELNKQRNFDEFRNKYISQSEIVYDSYQELVVNPPEADIYIVGSDQVWNFFWAAPSQVRALVNAYLLNFGSENIKRISYAASFGVGKIKKKYIDDIAPLLRKFQYISVRENSGISIINKCGINNAEIVPDPTMLLDKDIYRSLYGRESIEKYKKPYCLLYMLSNRTKFSIQDVYIWANSKNIDIRYVSANMQFDAYDKIYPTIPQWLGLVDNAQYVITNSYHCSVFSLLFQKKFAVVPMVGEDERMNDRFYTLFNIFDLKERFINNDFSVLDKETDWLAVSKVFERMRFACQLKNIIC
ncbi:hypothetical protein FACS189479_09460 [Spirochaetia bacterium]|nr:hypothetical protein FACS189479_09460 [Spirochaetia bacterium]